MRVSVPLPPALKAHFEDQAQAHGCSLGEELMQTLLEARPRPGKRTIRQKLMELEPMASDPNVPISEVVAAMERINPYRPRANGSAG